MRAMLWNEPAATMTTSIEGYGQYRVRVRLWDRARVRSLFSARAVTSRGIGFAWLIGIGEIPSCP